MSPDFFSAAWLSALATIIVIDLVLAGDNAIVIGLAARNVPKEMQQRVVLWGTAGAIVVRALLTLVVVWLLKFPAILWLGAAVLGWTAAKMIATEPLIKPWLDAHAPVRTALYVAIVGGLIAMPMWRSARPEQRALGAVVVLLAVWLTFWGWIEDASGFGFDGIDDWHWDNEIVDLIRWVGWIPFAIWLHRKIDAGPPVRATREPR